MKKILIISIFLFLIVFSTKVEVKANEDYSTFQEIELSSGKMLADYTDEEYEEGYKIVDKRKFWGWNTHTVNRDIKAKFVSETVFSYYNNGLTPITYEYSLSTTEVEKFSISATGNIGYTMKGQTEKFNHNLDTEIKINTNYETSSTTKEENNLEIVVQPKTVANLKIVGEAKVTNGIGAYYIFWIRFQRGGYEYFVVTTQYPRLEVLPI